MIESAAREIGYGWLSWIALTAEIVTAGAVFRVIGRVFFAWGPARDAFPKRGSHIREQPDMFQGHEHTPSTMFLPALALVLLALLIGLVPALPDAFPPEPPGWFEYGRGGVIPDSITWLTIGTVVLGTVSALYLHN